MAGGSLPPDALTKQQEFPVQVGLPADQVQFGKTMAGGELLGCAACLLAPWPLEAVCLCVLFCCSPGGRVPV